MKLNQEQIEKIREFVSLCEYDYYGIRTEDGGERSVGEILENSHNWLPAYEVAENLGVEIDELDEENIVGSDYDCGELKGACATAIPNDLDEDDLQRAVKIHKRYYGNKCYLIASNSREWGYDEGEVILEDAVVVTVL